MNTKVIIGKYRSEDVIYASSSGGAFTVLYEYAIANNYSVYGVKFDKNFKVKHSRATTIEECEEFRKSKYVLSDMKLIYYQVESDLRNGKYVLFTGTPCQCEAISNYIQLRHIETEKLLLVDLICHGAPNQKIFDEYRLENQNQMKDDWFRFRFRGKYAQNGIVNSRSAELYYKSGKFSYRTIKNDPFLKGYYGRLFYRKSCAECPFANPKRISDITIGDAWGIESSKSEWNSSRGVSLVLLNTQKGLTLLSEFQNKMEWVDSDLEWAVKNNSQLGRPTEMHRNRAVFFKYFHELGFQQAVEKAMSVPLWKKCVRKIKKFYLTKYRLLRKNYEKMF